MASPSFSKRDKVNIHKELDKILDYKLSMGPNVKEFENAFAKRLKINHAIGMNSCTSTLEAALNYFNVRGKEVIIPTQTFIATGMAVYHAGGIPKFAEVEEKTLSIDYEDVKKKINKKTVGIIIVHMAGTLSDDILRLKKLCKEKGLFLIEDAAHTPGAKIKSREAGTIGDIGCFSFYPSKILTAGEGGMLVTNSNKIAKFARSYQNRGADMSSKSEIYINPSRNVRMTEFSALLGRTQLSHLDLYLKNRRKIAARYKKKLSNNNNFDIVLPERLEQSSCWKVPLILSKKLNRDNVINKLKERNIFADKAYDPPLHLQPVMRKIFGTYKGLLPKSEQILSSSICLPSHQNMTNEDADYVSKNFLEIIDTA